MDGGAGAVLVTTSAAGLLNDAQDSVAQDGS
jgi:hypothetical protein